MNIPPLNAAPTVLLLCNHEGISNQVLFCLKMFGAKVYVLGGEEARFFKWSRYVEGFEFFECRIEDSDPAELVAVINKVSEKYSIDLVLGAEFEIGRRLSEIRTDVCAPIFPSSGPEIINRFHDKASFIEMTRACGAPVADSVIVPDKRSLEHGDLAARFGETYVVKPTVEGNGNGVVVIRSEAQLDLLVLGNSNYQFAPLLVAPFVPGIDVGLSLFAREGEILGAAAQIRSGPTLSFIDCPQLVAAAKQVVAAGGYTGVAHLDARLAPDGSISLLECNARFWSSIFALACAGVNFVEWGAASALGRPLPEFRDVVGQSATAPNYTILNFVKGASRPTPASVAWLKMAASDPAGWILGDLNYNRRQLLKKFRGTGRKK